MTLAAERVRNLVTQLGLSRHDAARLLRAIADELDSRMVNEHVLAAAEREAGVLRAQGLTVIGERLEVRTIAAASVLGRSEGTLRNWRCAGVGPAWRSDGGAVWYSLLDLMEWRASRSVTISAADPVSA